MSKYLDLVMIIYLSLCPIEIPSTYHIDSQFVRDSLLWLLLTWFSAFRYDIRTWMVLIVFRTVTNVTGKL